MLVEGIAKNIIDELEFYSLMLHSSLVVSTLRPQSHHLPVFPPLCDLRVLGVLPSSQIRLSQPLLERSGGRVSRFSSAAVERRRRDTPLGCGEDIRGNRQPEVCIWKGCPWRHSTVRST